MTTTSRKRVGLEIGQYLGQVRDVCRGEAISHEGRSDDVYGRRVLLDCFFADSHQFSLAEAPSFTTRGVVDTEVHC